MEHCNAKRIDHFVSSGPMRVWMAWLIFDVKVAQFEMNEWMQAAGYISDFCDAVRPKEVRNSKRN